MEITCQFMILKKKCNEEKNKNNKIQQLFQRWKKKMFSNQNVNKIVKNYEVPKITKLRVKIYEF